MEYPNPPSTVGFQTPKVSRYLDPKNLPKRPSEQVFGVNKNSPITSAIKKSPDRGQDEKIHLTTKVIFQLTLAGTNYVHRGFLPTAS